MERKCHILVVDDEPHVLVTYQLILQQQGYEVSAALSAEQARKMLLERRSIFCSATFRWRGRRMDSMLLSSPARKTQECPPSC